MLTVKAKFEFCQQTNSSLQTLVQSRFFRSNFFHLFKTFFQSHLPSKAYQNDLEARVEALAELPFLRPSLALLRPSVPLLQIPRFTKRA